MSLDSRAPDSGANPQASEATWSWRVDSDRVAYSAGWNAIVGEPPADSVGSLHAWLGRVHPDDVGSLTSALDRHLTGDAPEFTCQHRVRTKQGSFRWVVARAVASRDADGRAHLSGTLADVTERNAKDPLAGLPGVAALRAHVERLVSASERDPAVRFAVVLVDLDRFGALNDAFGHEVGDVLLREALRRVARCLREGDMVARLGSNIVREGTTPDVALPPLGGDECTVVLSHLGDTRDALRVAARIHDAMAAPFSVEGQRLFASVSIGVSNNSAAHDSAEEMLRDAYSALVRAKARGPAETQLFDDSARANASEFMEFAADLGTAIVEHQFEVWFQPVVDLHDGSIVRVEALLRWRHPTRGVLRPNTFIPLLEQTGTIVPVGWEALNSACTALAEWRRGHAPAHGIRVSVNLLARQFLESDLVPRLLAAVEAAGLEPRDLEVEVSELETTTHFDRAVPVTRALRDAGFKLTLDDFGLGLAGTEHIRELGIHTLKIDRAYIGGGIQHGGSSAIVQYATELAAILGIDVVAEGVETPTELEALRTLSCPMAQGFLFSRPIQSGDMLALLQRSDGTPAATEWWAGEQPRSPGRRRGSDATVSASR